ncbi:MAG TPA: RNase adapter RapZ [Nevskiaceae bacterium]|nr:RNase adapter RapZ [Nevskiaceae bacterium]
MKLVIVSGLSGAGKTVALKQYEDLGYYCIDNIPLALIGTMIGRLLSTADAGRYERLALGIDARESPSEIARFPQHLARLRARGVDASVVFLTAADDVILRRYSETRRTHPLADDRTPLIEAIALERRLLAPIADIADEPIDTSGMNLHELREAIHGRLPEALQGRLAVLFLSFGFKNGVPSGCDFLFDIRCLPNPHWDPALKNLTGRDPAVMRWLEGREDVRRMERDIRAFLDNWLPQFRSQDRAYVTIGVGCTGGRHRSVYLVDRLAEHFRRQFDPVIVKHKEIQ